MAVPEDANQVRRVSIPAPWGAAAIGLITNVKGSPKPILSVGYEWPFAPLGISPGLTKRESERLQLQVYVQDVWEGHGSPPFTVVEEGDRPDFQVRNARGIVGLDVTRLTSPVRRRAHDLFLRLKRDIETDSHSYSRLQGHMVNVWFADGIIPGAAVPPKRGDAATYDAVRNHLAMLAGAQSDSEPWIRGHSVSIPSVNAGFNIIPLDECYPGTHFYGECGFEMGLTFATRHTSDELWLEVQRLAHQHDYEGAGTLVVSVGAPAAPGGEVFPSDYLLWDAADTDHQPLKDLTHLSTVMVHDWWIGSVRKIYPTNELIVHPRRSGPVFPIRLPLSPEEVVGWQTQNIHETGSP